MCTALCSTAMIAWSLNDYHQFVAEFSGRSDLREIKERERWLGPDEPHVLRHTPESQGFTPDGHEIWLFRLCGLGIFHDPNDLSLLNEAREQTEAILDDLYAKCPDKPARKPRPSYPDAPPAPF